MSLELLAEEISDQMYHHRTSSLHSIVLRSAQKLFDERRISFDTLEHLTADPSWILDQPIIQESVRYTLDCIREERL